MHVDERWDIVIDKLIESHSVVAFRNVDEG